MVLGKVKTKKAESQFKKKKHTLSGIRGEIFLLTIKKKMKAMIYIILKTANS